MGEYWSTFVSFDLCLLFTFDWVVGYWPTMPPAAHGELVARLVGLGLDGLVLGKRRYKGSYFCSKRSCKERDLKNSVHSLGDVE